MAHIDYSKLFRCPKCGAAGAIYFLKVAGKRLIIRQRCPTHGGRQFELFRPQTNLVISHIRDGVFRCYKCGRIAGVDHTKGARPWALLKCFCPVHGNNLPYQKIWGTILNEIFKLASEKPQLEKTQLVSSETKEFCPNCGIPLQGTEKFCGDCGIKLN